MNTHSKNAPSNKTQVITKSMNMEIWEVGTMNQLFIRGYYTEIKFSKKKNKNKAVSGKTPFFVTAPFYILHSTCLSFGF